MDEQNLKCYGFICVALILLILAIWFFPIIVSFFAFFGVYWYITLPLFFIFIIFYRIMISKIRYKQLYLSFDNKGNQQEFEKKYRQKAVKDGKLTKNYILWLMKDIPKKHYITKEEKLYDIIILVVVYIVITLILLYLLELRPITISWGPRP